MTSPRHGHARLGNLFHISADVENQRRIVNLLHLRRIIGIIEADH